MSNIIDNFNLSFIIEIIVIIINFVDSFSEISIENRFFRIFLGLFMLTLIFYFFVFRFGNYFRIYNFLSFL